MTLVCALVALALGGSPTPVAADSANVEQPAAIAQATQAADMFLWAWMTCDTELGLQLLSRDLRRHVMADSADWFETYMSGMSNPHHLAFEVTGGELLGATRAKFAVVLFEHYQGEPSTSRRKGAIELVLEPAPGAGPEALLRKRAHRLTEPLEWRVDVLPATAFGPK